MVERLVFKVFLVLLFTACQATAQHILPDFKVAFPKDTFNYCAPKQILMLNLSVIMDREGHQDTSDRIDSVIWLQGDGQKHVMAYPAVSDSVVFNYLYNGSFDVTFEVVSKKGLRASLTKKKYIIFKGSNPIFKIVSDSGGEAPFTVKYYYKIALNASHLNFHFVQDGINYPDKDAVQSPVIQRYSDTVTYTYRYPGVYHPYIEEDDTFYDGTGGSLPPCQGYYPPQGDSSRRLTVTVLHSAAAISNNSNFQPKAIISNRLLTLSFAEPVPHFTLSISDIQGRLLWQGSSGGNETDFRFLLPHGIKGLIILQVSAPHDVCRQKLVVYP